jgi:hypothetical protein
MNWTARSEEERMINTPPAHWHSRAEEARMLAEDMDDPHCHKMMLQIAIDYDHLARLAQQRAEQSAIKLVRESARR